MPTFTVAARTASVGLAAALCAVAGAAEPRIELRLPAFGGSYANFSEEQMAVLVGRVALIRNSDAVAEPDQDQ